MNSEPWKVNSVAGYAGGQDRKAMVRLEVFTLADTCEEVRQKVEALPELLEACKQAEAELDLITRVFGQGLAGSPTRNRIDSAKQTRQSILSAIAKATQP